MLTFSDIESTSGWFSESGPSEDVVLSTKVRVARNLSGHTFPGIATREELDTVRERFEDVMQKIGVETPLMVAYLEEYPPTIRRMLSERRFISQHFALDAKNAVVLDSDGFMAAMINETDHLRLSCFRGGLRIDDAWTDIQKYDDSIADLLAYAFSLEYGYLCTDLSDTGTGLRGSVLLHLPGLERTNMMEKTVKNVVQLGFDVRGYFSDDEDRSLGDLYQVSDQLCIGTSEEQQLERLESVSQQLVRYERKARGELFEKCRIDIEDEVYRAYGVLTHCRKITAKEAKELLTVIRFGVTVGLLDLPLKRIDALLFLSQKAHMQYLIDSQECGSDSNLINYTRARVIQRTLNATGPEENHV
jgi:protein arginine kinase